jgi:HlyD family secretion protein
MNGPERTPEPITVRVASALFEIELGAPNKRGTLALWVVCGLFASLLLWALLFKLDVVTVAQGRLVPRTYVKVVQPAEPGIVREILATEGNLVRKGQVLLRLDATVNDADSQATDRSINLHRLQLRRIDAQLSGRAMKREPDDASDLYAQVEARRASHQQAFEDSVAQESVARERALRELRAAEEVLNKLEVTLPSYQKTAAAYARLASENLVGVIQAEEKAREATEKAKDLEAQRATVASLSASVREHDQRIAQLRSAYRSALAEERLVLTQELTQLEQQSSKLAFQGGLLELRAPQAGVVKQLATTSVGAVVQPGTVLVTLVPENEALMAEVLVENKDIAFVSVRQPVRLKLLPYEFQKYGLLDGTVRNVGADATELSGTNGEPQQQSHGSVYRVLVDLSSQKLSSDLPLAAGMQVSAEIVQGRRTVLEYLLSPVKRVVSEAASER